MEDFTMVKISVEDRRRLNILSAFKDISQGELLSSMVCHFWTLHVQTTCPHEWTDASTGSGDCVEEHSVCLKCGATE
jgi:hypothetical protein